MSAPFNGRQCRSCGRWLTFEYTDRLFDHPCEPRMRAACKCGRAVYSSALGCAYIDVMIQQLHEVPVD